MAAMVELFCDSFAQVPRRIVLDIDDTEDRVHGGQQLALFHAHCDSRCFLPIHIYEATTGKPVAVILRPGRTPDGAEVARSSSARPETIRARWPRVEILIRGDSHYARHEVMSWCERNRIGYMFGSPVTRLLAASPIGHTHGLRDRRCGSPPGKSMPRRGAPKPAKRMLCKSAVKF